MTGEEGSFWHLSRFEKDRAADKSLEKMWLGHPRIKVRLRVRLRVRATFG